MKKLFTIFLILCLNFTIHIQASNSNKYFPQDFIKIIQHTQNTFDFIHPLVKIMREKAIYGSSRIIKATEENEIINYFINSCNSIEKTLNSLTYKNLYIISKINNTITVVLLKPDIREYFTIKNPIYNGEINILDKIRERCKVAKNDPFIFCEQMNIIIGLIDKISININIISAEMNAYHIRASHAIYCNELRKIINQIDLYSSITNKQSFIQRIHDFKYFLKLFDRYFWNYGNLLQRIRELAIQSSNGVYTKEDRLCINIEMEALIASCQFYITHAKYKEKPIFFYKNMLFKDYAIPLHEFDTLTKVRLKPPHFLNGKDLLNDILMCGLKTPSDANRNIKLIEKALDNFYLIRASVGGFDNRLNFAIEYQNIVISSSNNKNYLYKSLIKSIEIRMSELAIQSANGIYTDLDRKQINFEYQELIKELNRIYLLTGVEHSFIDKKKYSVASQKNAEHEMIRLSEIFN